MTLPRVNAFFSSLAIHAGLGFLALGWNLLAHRHLKVPAAQKAPPTVRYDVQLAPKTTVVRAGALAGPGLAGPSARPAPGASVRPEFLDHNLEFIARQVRTQVDAHLRYPYSLKRGGVQGRVVAEVVLLPGGELAEVRLLRKSDSEELDALALQAVRDSAPFGTENRDRIRVKIPIEFLNHR